MGSQLQLATGERVKKALQGANQNAMRAAISHRAPLFGEYRLKDVTLIAGSARSGTSWLAEICASARRAPVLFEPDHPRYGATAGDQFFDFDPKVRDYYLGLVCGHGLPKNALVRGRLIDISHLSLIVKTISALGILPQLAAQIAPASTFLIVRHPCSVVVSRRLRGGFGKDTDPRLIAEPYLERFPNLEPAVTQVRTTAGQQALRWSIAHQAIVRASPPSWTAGRYERLALGQRSTILQVSRTLGVSSERIEKALPRPSFQARGRTEFANVARWRSDLSLDEIDEDLRVVHSAGIEWFDYDPLPVQRLPSKGDE